MLLPARSHFVGHNNLLTFSSTRKAAIAILGEKQGFRGKDSEGKYIPTVKELCDVLVDDKAVSTKQLLRRSLQHTFLDRPAPTYHAKTHSLKEKQPTFSDIYGITAPGHGKLLGMRETPKAHGDNKVSSKVVLLCFGKHYILTTAGYLTIPGVVDKILAEADVPEAVEQLATKEGYGHNYDSYTSTDFKPHAIVFTKPSYAMAKFALATKGFTSNYAANAGILSSKQNPSQIVLTNAPDKG
jgi:hypothetical protein